MRTNKEHLFIILAISVLLILIILDFLDSDFNFHDILVEFHGLFFDLIVFGIILTVYENFDNKRSLIEYYNSLLIDLREWNDDKNGVKIFKILEELNKLGAKKINISESYLNSNFDFSKLRNLKGSSFKMSNLMNSKFIGNDLRDSTFVLTRLDKSYFENVNFENSRISSCNMGNAKFLNVNFKNVVFTSSIFANTEFMNCNFLNADLNNITVHEENILEILKQNGNTGIEWESYKIEKNEMSFNGIKQNTLKRK
ncbi:pentapeptide repeat-containing protein [Polaribacter sp. Asnod6-C07]|uniref:pentapeptide repeat-containing protein n=1 Tax=Polaribacter sp. Asnod6-C07 TaxID=3160582 RepID=UPI00386D168D